MAQYPTQLTQKLHREMLNFCRHVAGDCQITATCVCGDFALGFSESKALAEVLLIVRDFQPRLINYVKTIDGRNVIFSTVDEWVFERDIDRGFLGEALASRLIFPYIALENQDYLHTQEVKLKKRLIRDLMESLVLTFPELSYELRIKPEYFMYEALLSRARLFPPMIYSLDNFMRPDFFKENAKRVLSGYKEALVELEKEKTVGSQNGCMKMSRTFVDSVRSRKTRFVSLFKTAQRGQRTLFTSLISIFPQIMSFMSQNRDMSLALQRITTERARKVHQVEDPQKYLYVPTADGLAPLANRIDIVAFARKTLSVDKDAKVKIEGIGGVLNDVYLIRVLSKGVEKKIVAKSFKDLSSFKWFPLTLWTVGTTTFAVSGSSRLERECAISQLLHSNGFAVPKVLHVSPNERFIFMEYVEGEHLEKTIKKIAEGKAASAVQEELNIMKKVGEKFAQIHALNIALGDTKPENIIIGKNGEIYMLDFEQASRGGDKVWDIAEFLYYAGHYIPPLVGSRPADHIARAFIGGYLKAGGNVALVKKAGNTKYTKVFSIFTFPHIVLAMSNLCRKAELLKA